VNSSNGVDGPFEIARIEIADWIKNASTQATKIDFFRNSTNKGIRSEYTEGRKWQAS
jgi:hypothetical protein